MQKENQFLNKKKKRNDKIKEKRNIPNSKPSEGATKLQNVEVLFKKAKTLYEMEAKQFDLDDSANFSKDKKWTSEILKTGTFEDKISSLVLYIKKNPRRCLKYLDMLLKMAQSKNRRQNESCVVALKDLFLESFLGERKLISFYNRFSTIKDEDISNDQLIEAYVEDFIHRKYLQLVEMIESYVVNDPIKTIKKKYMSLLLDMITSKPEREEKILDVLINKLGDPEIEVANHAIKLLKTLQENHPRMSLVLFKSVQNFMSKSTKGKYYALVYLSQMHMDRSKEFVSYSLNFFFDLFTSHSESESENSESFLSLIVKRINLLCRNKSVELKDLINEKMVSLFRLSHSKSLKLRIEVLKLIFNIIQSNETYTCRYYKSLYELLSAKEVVYSKHLREFLKLLMQSLMFDTNITRVAAIIKRLLQLSMYAEPSFISCTLIIVSQIVRNKNKLWKMIENPIKGVKEYDPIKRDPEYSCADFSIFSELTVLSKHYHPTIQKFSNFILQNFNKDIISYEGDPLIDFTLVNFLDKFMLKNPKIRKDKKTKKKTEEEELENFLNEDNDKKHIDEPKGEFDLDFIDKFNKVEPEVSSSKNYVKKQKKLQKKVDENKETEDDIEDFADEVINKEYEKYDREFDLD